MYTHLEDYIHDLYNFIGITEPRDLDMLLISKKLGIEVIYRDNAFRFDNEIVLIRRDEKEEWVDFGHEVCHFLRHSGSQPRMNPLFVELQEWQADNFMYHFCVPTFMLHALDLPRDRKKAIWEIQKNFNVNYDFAEKRLEKFTQQHAYVMLS